MESFCLDALKKQFLKGKLPHSLLFYGQSFTVLEQQALALTALVLSTDQPHKHLDFFSIRPVNKMRQIGVENLRDFIKKLQQTPLVGEYKVGIIFEADRLNSASSNALLKTLEEPPTKTILILLTNHLYKILPTLKSRCQNYRFHGSDIQDYGENFMQWMKSYDEWLSLASKKPTSSQDVAKRVMGVYQLTYSFEVLLKSLTENRWQALSKNLSEALLDEERDAYEVIVRKTIRQQLFYQVARVMRYHIFKEPISTHSIDVLIKAINILEDHVKLLDVNINESHLLEAFFLKIIRLWIRE